MGGIARCTTVMLGSIEIYLANSFQEAHFQIWFIIHIRLSENLLFVNADHFNQEKQKPTTKVKHRQPKKGQEKNQSNTCFPIKIHPLFFSQQLRIIPLFQRYKYNSWSPFLSHLALSLSSNTVTCYWLIQSFTENL